MTHRSTHPRDAFHPVEGGALTRHLPYAAVLGLALVSACAEDPAGSEDYETVRAFYTDILTDPAGTTEDRYYDLFSPDVVSIPTPPGGPGAEGMLNTIAFLGQVVPDLTWDPVEIIDLDDGRFVVRGNAVGTPSARSSAWTRPPATASTSCPSTS